MRLCFTPFPPARRRLKGIMILLALGLFSALLTLRAMPARAGIAPDAELSPPAAPAPPAQEITVQPMPAEDAGLSLEEQLQQAADSRPDSPFAPASDEGQTLFYCYQGKVPDHRLVVVDKSRQRIMVLNYLGEMVLEYEFPCATGTQEGDKLREGDERTPEGIYFTTHRFQDNKVTVFGDRAIHLDYPNAFDQSLNKKGNGIFIHGTDRNLKARSSSGCVAMRNEDIAILWGLIKEQRTPVIVLNRLKFPTLEERVQLCSELQKFSIDSLEKTSPRLGTALGLRNPPPGFNPLLDDRLTRLKPLYAAFAQKNSTLKTSNNGIMALGIGNTWVLAADQRINGAHKQNFSATRRFYLEGQSLDKANLLMSAWVLPDSEQAQKLAALAPKPLPQPAPVLASSKRTAPIPAPNESISVAQEPAPPASAAASAGTPEEQIRGLINNWLKAWTSKDLNAYMSFYAADFEGDGRDREAWRQHKAGLNKTYKKINVRADDLRMEIKGTVARVFFVQRYRSDWYKDTGRKELDLVLRNGRWQLVAERWQAI